MEIIGVTNRKLCEDFYSRIREISQKELKYLILREKDLVDEELEIMAARIKGILKDSKIKLIINGNMKVADNVNAYGVHFSYNNFINLDIVEFQGIKGVSVHSYNEAVEAEKRGADYLIYGHIFETDCKKGLKPKGVNELKKICNKVKIPVYGIGGINKNNYMKVINSGAKGIAIMSSLMNK